jgi:CO/xanthine dehydrogenase FAD-binding subunit
VLQAAADAAVEGAAPLEHNGYKLPLVRSLVRRALDALVLVVEKRP